MKIEALIESLRFTSGTSDKGYAMIRLTLGVGDSAVQELMKARGRITSPVVVRFERGNLEKIWNDTIADKTRYYRRLSPPTTYQTELREGSPGFFESMSRWLCMIMERHGEWADVSDNFQKKLVISLKEMALPKLEDTDVEDLFLTVKQRGEKRQQEMKQSQELQSLSNWGVF